MESALTPREIQARIRSGESLEEVALAAGVPAEQIGPFAGPVLAERVHVADLAKTCQVRRRGEASAHRTLREAMAEKLTARGIDPDTVEWDAWRREDKLWIVRAGYLSGSAPHEALFTFDSRGRFSTASNEDARWLIGDDTNLHGPQPGRRRPNPDTEPTVDLHDELALVRVVQEADTNERTLAVSRLQFERVTRSSVQEPDAQDEIEDYSPVELQQVDGVYDIVPNAQSDMDVLYEMLSSFNEDSVNVYAGLTQPITPTPPPASMRQPEGPEDGTPNESELAETADLLSSAEPEQERLVDLGKGGEPTVTPAPKRAPSASRRKPYRGPSVVGPAAPADTESSEATTQDVKPLDESSEPTQPTKPTRTRKRGQRASVPSWDEIMFGAPKPHAD